MSNVFVDLKSKMSATAGHSIESDHTVNKRFIFLETTNMNFIFFNAACTVEATNNILTMIIRNRAHWLPD